MSSDLYKAHSLNVPGALALIKIDDFLEQESLFDGDPLHKVIKIVAETIAKEMTPMNLFGRVDEKLFAVHFFNTVPKMFLFGQKNLELKLPENQSLLFLNKLLIQSQLELPQHRKTGHR